jgi:hypothetical protein
MFESKSDDDSSSEASSGDEMLNLVPFSQETTTSSTTPEKSAVKDSEVDNSDDKIQSGMKRKHDELDADVECITDDAKLEEKGESLLLRAIIFPSPSPHNTNIPPFPKM